MLPRMLSLARIVYDTVEVSEWLAPIGNTSCGHSTSESRFLNSNTAKQEYFNISNALFLLASLTSLTPLSSSTPKSRRDFKGGALV
jgi:hypothetical protein